MKGTTSQTEKSLPMPWHLTLALMEVEPKCMGVSLLKYGCWGERAHTTLVSLVIVLFELE